MESLDQGGAGLHPAQQAMVDHHGSQCGFCTPGFVMSLFALYKTTRDPSRRQIDDALAGNLCRCTGYRPIIAAAGAMYEMPPAEDDWKPSGPPPSIRRPSSDWRNWPASCMRYPMRLCSLAVPISACGSPSSIAS